MADGSYRNLVSPAHYHTLDIPETSYKVAAVHSHLKDGLPDMMAKGVTHVSLNTGKMFNLEKDGTLKPTTKAEQTLIDTALKASLSGPAL